MTKPAAPARLGPPRRGRETVRINHRDLVVVAVAGQIAHPVGRANPYRIGNDGVPRVLPATGGIAVNQRIGDRCVGLAGDHIEPGVTLHNNRREVVGPRSGPNDALITYACVGNRARVISGPCTGQWGLVTGKHGGINHVMVDFPTPMLRQLQIGDRIQVYSCGLGLRLADYPEVAVFNCAPALLRAWGIVEDGGTLSVPVTHLVPAAIMGSGLGKNTVWRGDYDPALRCADPQALPARQPALRRHGRHPPRRCPLRALLPPRAGDHRGHRARRQHRERSWPRCNRAHDRRGRAPAAPARPRCQPRDAVRPALVAAGQGVPAARRCRARRGVPRLRPAPAPGGARPDGTIRWWRRAALPAPDRCSRRRRRLGIVGADGRGSIARTSLGLSVARSISSRMVGLLLPDAELPFEGYGDVLLGEPGPVLGSHRSPLLIANGPKAIRDGAGEHIRFELRTTDHTALSPGRAIEPHRAVDPSTRRPRSVPGSGAFRGLDLGGRAGRHARRRGPQRLVGHGLDEIPETNYLKTLFCRVL